MLAAWSARVRHGASGPLSALALVRFRVGARGGTVRRCCCRRILFPAIILGLALLVFYHRVGLAGTFGAWWRPTRC